MEYVTKMCQNFKIKKLNYHWQKYMTMEKILNYYIAEVYFETNHDFVLFGLLLVEQNTS